MDKINSLACLKDLYFPFNLSVITAIRYILGDAQQLNPTMQHDTPSTVILPPQVT